MYRYQEEEEEEERHHLRASLPRPPRCFPT
jgi:hypothetical protein